jgi:aerobic-type carbon monoxide dehydrogenase small subunit (CoxS/CutS family)
MSQTIELELNGEKIGPQEVPDTLMMIEFLHEYLNLTGTKFGCGVGVCHACTVILDNADGTSEILRTCINPVARFNKQKVRTVEGHATLGSNGEVEGLSPVQQAFLEHYSFQCGWCTPGFVNEGTVLLENLAKNPVHESDVESVVEKALGEHVCRCTGYVKYYAAMKELILETKGLTYS